MDRANVEHVTMLLLILVSITAVGGAASSGSCEYGEWSSWVERKASNGKGDYSFPSHRIGVGVDHGRQAFDYMMQIKLANAKYRAECEIDGSCPEMIKDNDEGHFLCVSGKINGHIPCRNINQESFVSLSTMAQKDNVIMGNDIWGWTDPVTGDEYAIFGYYSGTAFVRVTDPRHPVVLGRLDTHSTGSIWRDIKVVNDHAFIVAEARDHGIQVFDLTQLRNASSYTVYNATVHYGHLSNCHNVVSNEETEFVYAVGCTRGDNGCLGGLHAVDVSDPTNPTFAGCYGGDAYVHDAQCVIYNGPDTSYVGREICFCYNEDTFTIVDATNKASMRMISRTGYGNARYTHQGWLTEDHTIVLLDDELDEMRIDSEQRTYIWDVADLDHPFLRNTYKSGIRSIDHNQYIVGDLVYQSNYESGLRVLNIDLKQYKLTEVAYFDVYPAENEIEFRGSWSVYPYFRSGNVIISSIDYGLFVVRPNMAAIRATIEEDTPKTEYTRYREIIKAENIDSCPALSETKRV